MNEIQSRINIGINKTYLMFTSTLRNKSTLILITLIPFLSIVPALFFIPFWGGSSFVLQINVITVSSLIYGNIVFGYKKSTLDNNEKLVSKSRSVSYLSSLIIIVIFTLLSSMIQIFYLFVANWLNILMPDWVWSNDFNSKYYILSNMRWFAWLWSIMWTTLITFGIYFALRKLIKNMTTHYIILCAIWIISFVWGGSLNDYWPQVMYKQEWNHGEVKFISTLFPSYLYWPTVILFPFYAPGQIASISSDFSIHFTKIEDNWLNVYYESFKGGLIHLSFNNEYEYMWKWNALIIMPIIWTLGLFTVGVIQSEKV